MPLPGTTYPRGVRGLVGREVELAEIEAFIADAAGGAWAVVIEGEAGIGKSALWRAVRTDLDADALVLEVRLTSSESSLAFAGLTDLLAPVPAALIEGLPTPQRSALEVATLRSPPTSEPVDPRAVATALATLLGRLADDGPIVLAVDDLQWVDVASRAAIEFALRRVVGRRVGLLLTVRGAGGAAP